MLLRFGFLFLSFCTESHLQPFSFDCFIYACLCAHCAQRRMTLDLRFISNMEMKALCTTFIAELHAANERVQTVNAIRAVANKKTETHFQLNQVNADFIAATFFCWHSLTKFCLSKGLLILIFCLFRKKSDDYSRIPLLIEILAVVLH